MNIRAEIARSAYYRAQDAKVIEIFFCCNALVHAALSRGVRLESDILLSLAEEFEELFGDATFWVHTNAAEDEKRLRPDHDTYTREQRHIDRVNVLDLFATILESEDD